MRIVLLFLATLRRSPKWPDARRAPGPALLRMLGLVAGLTLLAALLPPELVLELLRQCG